MAFFDLFSIKSKNNHYASSGNNNSDDVLLNSIVQSIYSAIFVISLSGKVIYANDKFGELWRIPKRIMREKNDKKLMKFVTKEVANPREFINKVNYLSKNKSLESKDDIAVKDGRIFEWISLPHFDRNKKIIGRVWNFRDVTHHRRTEMEMRALSARQQAILQSIPDIIMGVDNRKVYNWANQAGLNFFGKGVIGKKADYYFEGRQKVYEAVEPVFRGLKEVVYLESWQRRQDGQKRLLAWWCSPLKDGQGKVLGAVSTAKDITEQRKAEQAKERSEKEYRDLLERSNDGIVILRDSLIKYANPAMEKLTGFKLKNIINQPMINFVAPQYRKLVINKYLQRMAGLPIETRYEFSIITAENKIMPVETNSSVVDFEGKKADMAILRDMTRSKEVDRMKSEFIAVASHQLRTPLTGIKWFSQLLLADKTNAMTETQKDYLLEINNSNERMIKLVNDLLDVSHIETGRKFSVIKKNIDVISIIKRVMGSEAVCHGVCNIKFELDKGTPSKFIIPADEKKIEQVFVNLISNAIKYSGSSKKIIVGAHKINNDAYFSVKDFGVGIPKRQQHLIFQKFFRADNIATLSQDGTGLGLYIVKSIVEAHGGKISFDSKENKGTTFYFTLPLK